LKVGIEVGAPSLPLTVPLLVQSVEPALELQSASALGDIVNVAAPEIANATMKRSLRPINGLPHFRFEA
jgi:hypothetical protein